MENEIRSVCSTAYSGCEVIAAYNVLNELYGGTKRISLPKLIICAQTEWDDDAREIRNIAACAEGIFYLPWIQDMGDGGY